MNKYGILLTTYHGAEINMWVYCGNHIASFNNPWEALELARGYSIRNLSGRYQVKEIRKTKANYG